MRSRSGICPKRWADLLEPRWRGMLGVEAKSGEWYCSLLKNLGEEKGTELFREIAARNGLFGAQRQFGSGQHGGIG